jgi:hypothetical protein
VTGGALLAGSALLVIALLGGAGLLLRAARAGGPRAEVRVAWLVGLQLALFGLALGTAVGRLLLGAWSSRHPSELAPETPAPLGAPRGT